MELATCFVSRFDWHLSPYGSHILKSGFRPELALRLLCMSSHEAHVGQALHQGVVDKTSVFGCFKAASSVTLYFVVAVCRPYFKIKTLIRR